MPLNNDLRSLRRNPEMESILSILSSNNLAVRDERKVTRGIITAVQPLAIDGKEICTDTLLAELINYKTADQMIRETDALVLKKTAFGAFESSMTSIPKYCFKNIAALQTVLVHSIAPFTLDDILNVCENKYSPSYTYKQFNFYSDWVHALFERLQQHTKPGKTRLFRMAVELPKCVFPEPPRIDQLQRRTFAAQMLRIVEQHHRSGIYHDCISERTFFFPTLYQPLVLSNYSGVPSSMLSDLIPSELMTDEAVANYGPQCRDIYCLALICYRIMTGEQHDGKRFTLESPRPMGMVVSEIARSAQLAFRFNNPADAKHSFVSLYKTVKEIALLAPPLFSGNSFTVWRKLNNATGGLWRSIPAVGPFCAVFIPTRIARSLRYILDKPWFLTYFFRKGSPAGRSNSRGPDIAILTAAFNLHRPSQCPRFESALNALISESALRRQAFGSIMETGFSIKRAYHLIVDRKYALLFSTTALLIIAVLLTLPHRSPKMTGVVTAQPSMATKPEPLPPARPSTRAKPPLRSMNDAKRAINTIVKNTPSPPVRSVAGRPVRTPATAQITTEPVRQADEKPFTLNHAQKSNPANDTEIALVPKGSLFPAIGYPDVFIVTGIEDSCNPGKLYYSRRGREDAIMISQTPTAALKLFMTHRSSARFGPIEAIRLCRTGGCDQTMYYKAVGTKEIGEPVYVKAGDVISPDRIKLRLFIKARQSLHKK